MSDQSLPQGHQTDTPAEIAGDGWWEVAKRVRLALTHNHFSMIAAGLAFHAMLSIFPALATLVSLNEIRLLFRPSGRFPGWRA